VPCSPDHALRDRGGIVYAYPPFCVSRSEALLMASNTSYLNMHRVTLVLPGLNRASFVTYKCSAVVVPDLGCEGSLLALFLFSRFNLLWLVFNYQRFSLISA
jgi:hypothetical protein